MYIIIYIIIYHYIYHYISLYIITYHYIYHYISLYIITYHYIYISLCITKNSTQFNRNSYKYSTKNKVMYLTHAVYLKLTNICERKIILDQLFIYLHFETIRNCVRMHMRVFQSCATIPTRC